MSTEKILFERGKVFIKERLPQSDLRVDSNDEILGTVIVHENSHDRFLTFKPIGSDKPVNDDWALVNGAHSIISYKNSGQNRGSISVTSNSQSKYRFSVHLNDIRSIRRNHNIPAVAHIIIVLKSGSTLPALHFKIGGSKELLSCLQQYIKMQKSSQDPRVYIVNDEPTQFESPEPVSAFDQLNLFNENSLEISKRTRGQDPRRVAIEKFAKVTHFFRDNLLGQNDMIASNNYSDEVMGSDITAIMESLNEDIKDANNDSFAVIYKVDFKNLPEVTRGPVVTSQEWQNSFDKDGRMIDVRQMKERIFRGGLESNELRREVWKYLLYFYPWSSTRDERIEIATQRKLEYFAMKLQWKSMTEAQKHRNTLFRDRESLIEKDVTRTDRTHEYFEGDNNVHLPVLHDVLMTYVMYNTDLGYVQGMNDLLSPILIVMENEVDAFWCFAGLMERMQQNFHMDQSHIKRQLGNLHTLLQYIDADLASYLAENNSSNMYFFFRWMLICFKREFSFEDVMYLWEVLWTDHMCENFELLVCLAILISQKSVIMDSKFGCNEILKHINDLSLKVELEPLLKHAEGLYILLKQHDQTTSNLPPSISAIIFPKRTKSSGSESDSDVNSPISSVKTSRDCSPNVARPPRTRHLTESHSIDEHDSAVVSVSKTK